MFRTDNYRELLKYILLIEKTTFKEPKQVYKKSDKS
jgi:hypothetical protein